MYTSVQDSKLQQKGVNNYNIGLKVVCGVGSCEVGSHGVGSREVGTGLLQYMVVLVTWSVELTGISLVERTILAQSPLAKTTPFLVRFQW